MRVTRSTQPLEYFWDLSDALAVSKPLSEITDLADVIGFVKRQEGDQPTNLAIERRWAFRCWPGQQVCGRFAERSHEFGGDFVPAASDFLDCGVLVLSRQRCTSREER